MTWPALNTANLKTNFELLRNVLPMGFENSKARCALSDSFELETASSRLCFLATCDLSSFQAELLLLLSRHRNNTDTLALLAEAQTFKKKLESWYGTIDRSLRYNSMMEAFLFELQ